MYHFCILVRHTNTTCQKPNGFNPKLNLRFVYQFMHSFMFFQAEIRLKNYETEGYIPIQLTSLRDWKQRVNAEEKCTVLLDDTWGLFNIDQ